VVLKPLIISLPTISPNFTQQNSSNNNIINLYYYKKATELGLQYTVMGFGKGPLGNPILTTLNNVKVVISLKNGIWLKI